MKIHKAENGFTLVLSLILLVILAGIAVSALNTTKANLNIAANTQVQRELLAANQRAIDYVIGEKFFDTTDWTSGVDSIEVLIDEDGDSSTTTKHKVIIFRPQCLHKVDAEVIESSAGIELASGSANEIVDLNIRATVEDPYLGGGKLTINQGYRITLPSGTCAGLGI